MEADEPARPSWPLNVMAGLGFVPVLGILFGSIAVTWGLLADRRGAKRAAAAGAIGALANIAAVVALASQLLTSDDFADARVLMVETDLAAVVAEIEDYRAEEGRYPATLLELVGQPIPRRLVNIYDQSVGLLARVPYVYRRAADGKSYDLFAAGPDKAPMTSDDIRPLQSDTAVARSGYRPPPG